MKDLVGQLVELRKSQHKKTIGEVWGYKIRDSKNGYTIDDVGVVPLSDNSIGLVLDYEEDLYKVWFVKIGDVWVSKDAIQAM